MCSLGRGVRKIGSQPDSACGLGGLFLWASIASSVNGLQISVSEDMAEHEINAPRFKCPVVHLAVSTHWTLTSSRVG